VEDERFAQIKRNYFLGIPAFGVFWIDIVLVLYVGSNGKDSE
jgi:hypothetical protein